MPAFNNLPTEIIQLILHRVYDHAHEKSGPLQATTKMHYLRQVNLLWCKQCFYVLWQEGWYKRREGIGGSYEEQQAIWIRRTSELANGAD